MNHYGTELKVEQRTLATAVDEFFEVFEDHFKDDPDFDHTLPLDENISGHSRTVTWSTIIDGVCIEFRCRRVAYGSSDQWITYEDGVRQLAPHKPFNPVQCASAMKRAIESMKCVQKEGA